ncbi:hypothetical protein Tco_1032857 [Tanacetum coccineum]|uniref:Uncharacterized protein n=1 Tax=Tanacetum coccineum TaxID=301880 RepID=A0ABQ5GEE7_9ASTR
MKCLVKISKKARILELKQRHLKITILTSNTPYSSRKIRRICACTSQKTTKETRSIRHIQGRPIRHIQAMEIKYSGRYQSWSLLQEIPNTPRRKINSKTLYINNTYTKTHQQPPKELPTPSPSVTTTSAEDYTRYLNDPKEVQMSELLNEPLYTKATTMTVSLILETIHETQENVITTLPATPPIKTKKKRAKTLMEKLIKKKNDWKKTIMQRLTNLEQKNHDDVIKESVQVNVLNEVKNQLPDFLLKVVSEYKNRSFLAHEKHLDLYNALMNSMGIDENDAKGNFPSQHKRSHDGRDPPEDHKGEKRRKRRQKDVGGSLSKRRPPGRKRILVSYFFNHDMEYLKYRTKENMYALSVTKIKAVRYEDEGIEEMIQYL